MNRAVRITFTLLSPFLLFAACSDKSCEPPGYNYLEVPAEFATIQMAIDAAQAGDTILLAPGTYGGEGNSDVYVAAKPLTIKSSGDPTETVIQGDSAWYPALTIAGCSQAQFALIGISFRGGRRGIECDSSAILIMDCDFREFDPGYVIRATHSSVDMYNNRFSDNYVPVAGMALVWAVGCIVDVADCTFARNTCFITPLALAYSRGEVSDCAFVDNYGVDASALRVSGLEVDVRRCTMSGGSGGRAIEVESGGGLVLSSCVLCGNEWQAMWIGIESVALISCCNFYSTVERDWTADIADQLGVRGNFFADPKFVDPAGGDFRLCPDSPCAPDNNQCGELIGRFPVAESCP